MAELLSARLCHELAGTTAGLTGSIELAIANNDATALALALEHSVLLTARLRLLRAAWGPASDPLDVVGLRAMLPGLPRFGRVRPDLDRLDADSMFAAPVARLLINVLLLAVESLPLGGRVSMARQAPHTIVVLLEGQRAAWPPGFSAVIEGPIQSLPASPIDELKGLQGQLTIAAAHDAGVPLEWGPPESDCSKPRPLLLDLAGA